MEQFTINLSMLNEENTGLGVYACHCAENLERKFRCAIFASTYKSKFNNKIIQAPRDNVFSASGKAAWKRFYYSVFQYPKNLGFLYSPTHHGFFGERSQVITIHDLVPIHHAEGRKMQYYYFKYILPKLIKVCKAVFTVSENAKEDICKYYKLSSNFVYVIPNGVDKRFYTYRNIPEKKQEERPYLLVVGARYFHKNVHEILKNRFFWANKYSLKIVSTGGTYFESLEKMVKEYKLEDKVVFFTYVDEDKLLSLYKNCKALIYPSLWEGFGIPPLEALSLDKPVIVSDIPVIREVIGDAGIYIKIGNEKSWGKAFLDIENPQLIQEKISTGEKRLEEYTWEKSGEKLVSSLLDIEPRLSAFLI